MRSKYKIVVCSLLTLSITSCEKDLLEKEQYQKEIYLIGAYNRVWTTEVSYSNEEVKTYFTVSSSGTLALDRDVNVKMKINEELVDIYNKKYWTVLNEDKYYKSLDMPVCLPELNLGELTEEDLRELSFRCTYENTRRIGAFQVLDMEDVYHIYCAANEE